MKLIIDIPEEKYKTIQEGMYCGMLDADLYRDIKNGTPLDKLRAELHATAELHDDGDCYLRDEWIDEYFDKYKAEIEPQESEKVNG